MKKSGRTLFGSKFSPDFRYLSSDDWDGATAAEFVPAEVEKEELFSAKPRFEKLGGMETRVRDFISQHCNLADSSVSILRTSNEESINRLPEKTATIINLKRVNDIREINRFFCAVNKHLPEGGTFIGCVETKFLRRRRIFKKFPPIINRVYYILDFILKRVFPKLPVTRNFYLWLTGGRNKVMSRTEALGRLYAAGFEVTTSEFIGNNLYFVAGKIKKPLFNRELLYGTVLKMRRHGKGGKIIYVYKLRTMHAYSEFIQQYVYKKNNLAEGGKLKDDFRVSAIGKVLRKFWIDELPMIYNLLRGDLKIVGVRPLSTHYLSLYSDELREKRSSHKPGLFPPFYADLPKTLDQIQASEMKYLASYDRNPLLTDMKYFFLACYNIFIKRARSK